MINNNVYYFVNKIMLKQVPNKQRKLANSQFIREKLDFEYTPSDRVKSSFKSPYEVKIKPKSPITNAEKERITKAALVSVKTGKKIRIDWTVENNFRTTTFPHMKNKLSTQESQLKSENENLKVLRKMSLAPPIEEKKSLLSQFLDNKPKVFRLKRKLKTEPVEESVRKSSLTIVEREKYEEFVENNKRKIKEAIEYESICMAEEEQKEKKIKKNKVTILKQKLAAKTKLALLKYSLIKGLNENEEHKDEENESRKNEHQDNHNEEFN